MEPTGSSTPLAQPQALAILFLTSETLPRSNSPSFTFPWPITNLRTGPKMTSTLGKLVAVPLRSVWPHEAVDFTKWLAAADNMHYSLTNLDWVNRKGRRCRPTDTHLCECGGSSRTTTVHFALALEACRSPLRRLGGIRSKGQAPRRFLGVPRQRKHATPAPER
jgi:hypothetical protein